MHDLGADCTILYASESINEVLGYQPNEVVQRSTFDFFHPQELPFARAQHKDSIAMDHASVLAYVQVRNKNGAWTGCECVFSCVYDVIVAATTIYRQGSRSQGRALAAPMVQRAFRQNADSARQDMLVHLSAKFTSLAPNTMQETRCAMILNRFTKSLSILYATHAIKDLYGEDPLGIVGRSFLDFVDHDCLEGAVDAIDRAKENDSVAYMRFRWRPSAHLAKRASPITDMPHSQDATNPAETFKGLHTDNASRARAHEVEAVVSCTSDGIVIVLRCLHQSLIDAPRGLFAAPWSSRPLYPAPPKPLKVCLSATQMRRSLNEEVMQSIQDISVFVWGLQHNKSVVLQHALGQPGPYAVPKTSPAVTETEKLHLLLNQGHGAESQQECDLVPVEPCSSSSAENIIDIDSD